MDEVERFALAVFGTGLSGFVVGVSHKIQKEGPRLYDKEYPSPAFVDIIIMFGALVSIVYGYFFFEIVASHRFTALIALPAIFVGYYFGLENGQLRHGKIMNLIMILVSASPPLIYHFII